MTRLLDRNRCECLKLNKTVIIRDGEHNEKLWRENFEQALAIHNHLERTYISLKYTVIEVPTGTIEERVNFILATIK